MFACAHVAQHGTKAPAEVCGGYIYMALIALRAVMPVTAPVTTCWTDSLRFQAPLLAWTLAGAECSATAEPALS